MNILLIINALVNLINEAWSEGKESAHKIAKRLAMVIPKDRLKYLVEGVPVKATIKNGARCREAIAKNSKYAPHEIVLDDVRINKDFNLEVHYKVAKLRYAKSAEEAEELQKKGNSYSGNSSKTDEYQFPFTVWDNDWRRVDLDEELEVYGIEIERF